MDNLDYIEDYFSKVAGADLTREFEERIHSDPGFAEEVAFYLAAQEVAAESARSVKKDLFKEIYEKHRVKRTVPVKKLAYYIATAAVVSGLIFAPYTFFNPVSPGQLGD